MKKHVGVADLSRKKYTLFILILVVGSLLVIIGFSEKLKELVDFATTVSFLVAPIIAIFNFKLVTGKFIEKNQQPPMWLKILGYAGVIFLIGFAVFFITTKLGFVFPVN